MSKSKNSVRQSKKFHAATEIKRLQGEIARLKKELENRDWASKKTNEGIKILYKELEKQNGELKKLDELKSNFVSHVSHELRTPLTNVREANAQLLEELQGSLNKDQRRFLEISQNNLNRLLRIINNLLDLSRLEAGKIKLERKAVDISTLAREVIDSLNSFAERKQIKLENKLPAHLPEIVVDSGMIRQVLSNLVDNALKYTAEKGRVTLSSEQKKDVLEISVVDTGIGISPEYLGKIFDRFERARNIPISVVGGAGLGLSICTELLDLHKGRIRVESELGKGSKFTFSLPLLYELDFFKDYLEAQIQEAKKQCSFVSLIMVYIENFTQLKKELGIKVVANCKEQLETLIESYIRDPMDKLLRYGDRTLILVLIGASKENAQVIKRRLGASAVKQKFKIKDRTIKFSLKFKEVTYPVDGQTGEELIRDVKDIIS